MCQLCEEANLYMAQLEAAERKAADAKARSGGTRADKAAGKPDEAAANVGRK